MVSYEFESGHIIELRFIHIQPDLDSVVPRIKINTEVAYQTKSGISPLRDVSISYMRADLKIKSGGSVKFVSTFIPESPLYYISPGCPYTIPFLSALDHYTIEEIEKLGASGNLTFLFIVFGIIEHSIPSKKVLLSISLEFEVPKSHWVENILPGIHAKDVALIEIPKLKNSKFTEAINYLNEAWKAQSMGSYDDTLTKCRKALESIDKAVKEMGFKKKETNNDGRKKVVPDWTLAFGPGDVGNIFGVIFHKEFGFTVPGAHAGKAINREDGEFALLITHALANYVVRKVRLT